MGVIQVTAYLKKHPDLVKADIQGPFCEIVGEDVQSTKINEIDIDKSDFFYDFEIHDNFLYVMTGNSNLQAVEVTPKLSVAGLNTRRVSSEMKVAWEVKDMINVSKTLFGSQIHEACLAHHGNQSSIYIPTDVGLLRLNITTRNVSIAGSGVYLPKNDIIYCDIVQDVLFVAFLNQGLHLYNVKDPGSIKLIGVMDSDYFQKSGRNPGNQRLRGSQPSSRGDGH